MIFNPEALIAALLAHDVRFVLIGGLAATLHGSTIRTGDADICPARDPDNLERLAAALSDIRARIRASDAPGGVAFACDAQLLARIDLLNLVTTHGLLDICFEPAGTTGYEDLIRGAVVYDLDGLRVPVAGLDDVIRSKRAANRAKDRAALPELEALREEIQRRK